jgi:hypothetical protein
MTLRSVCVVLLAASLTWAQSVPSNRPSPADNPKDLAHEIEVLRQALAETQRQVAAQQREIEALKNKSKSVEEEAQARTGPDTNTAPATAPNASSFSLPQGSNASSTTTSQTVANQKELEPSAVRIGKLVFTPGGFLDFENIYRTTNTQSNIATDFATIPFNNTSQGNISEFRSTAQFSRLTLKISSKVGKYDTTSYIETDFSGNDATNVYQSTNGHTHRLRLFFVDSMFGKLELLAGQTWSWITPNRNGLGPMPVDLALTYNEDQNLGVGVPYTRAAEFRAAYHFNDRWAFGIGMENPNQYIGNFVALPVKFTSVGPQFDNGNQIGAPNIFPDILSKLAYDKTLSGGRHFHAEAVGLLTGVHLTVKSLLGTSSESHRAVGGGGSLAASYEFSHTFRILANAFWSDGGAHYLVGTGPEVVIRPNAAGTDVTPSFVHAGAGSAGFEWYLTRKTAVAGYYGLDYYGRNFFPDKTNTANPHTIIGFGGPGSPNTNNRTIQQASFDWIQTFWKDPGFGAIQFYAQYSYLTRAPWFVAPGDPRNAHLSMIYAGIRYMLPSTAVDLGRVARPQ